MTSSACPCLTVRVLPADGHWKVREVIQEHAEARVAKVYGNPIFRGDENDVIAAEISVRPVPPLEGIRRSRRCLNRWALQKAQAV